MGAGGRMAREKNGSKQDAKHRTFPHLAEYVFKKTK